MNTAKIIRHRHKYYHYMNDDLKNVKEETFFKIVFSAPSEMDKFTNWCIENKGEYDYDKENSCQRGKLPQIEIFKDEICWCDIMTYYLLHVSGYKYHSALSPYKGEVYVKEEDVNI
jgi:hypothetical protein